jgi:hypothetical protein
MEQLTIPGLEPQRLELCKVYRSKYFGLCRVIEIIEEPPSPAYECVPLEFEHPFGTVFMLAEDVLSS